MRDRSERGGLGKTARHRARDPLPAPRRRKGRGRFHCGRGGGTLRSASNPRKRQWCLLSAARRREGVPHRSPRPPRPAVVLSGDSEDTHTQEGAGAVVLTDREAARLRDSEAPIPSGARPSLPPWPATAGRGVRKDVRAPALCLRRFDVTPRGRPHSARRPLSRPHPRAGRAPAEVGGGPEGRGGSSRPVIRRVWRAWEPRSRPWRARGRVLQRLGLRAPGPGRLPLAVACIPGLPALIRGALPK